MLQFIESATIWLKVYIYLIVIYQMFCYIYLTFFPRLNFYYTNFMTPPWFDTRRGSQNFNIVVYLLSRRQVWET